jgi:hypothetical protein
VTKLQTILIHKQDRTKHPIDLTLDQVNKLRQYDGKGNTRRDLFQYDVSSCNEAVGASVLTVAHDYSDPRIWA